MSIMTIEAGTDGRTVAGRSEQSLATRSDQARSEQSRRVQTRPGRIDRPGRGSARQSAPTLRPGRGLPAPELRREATVARSACAVPLRPVDLVRAPVRARSSGARAARSTLRLTDRGIAVVLVTGVMIAVAALTVIGATAARVTSDGYHAGSGSLASSNR